jgi:hypothetical protein
VPLQFDAYFQSAYFNLDLTVKKLYITAISVIITIIMLITPVVAFGSANAADSAPVPAYREYVVTVASQNITGTGIYLKKGSVFQIRAEGNWSCEYYPPPPYSQKKWTGGPQGLDELASDMYWLPAVNKFSLIWYMATGYERFSWSDGLKSVRPWDADQVRFMGQCYSAQTPDWQHVAPRDGELVLLMNDYKRVWNDTGRRSGSITVHIFVKDEPITYKLKVFSDPDTIGTFSLSPKSALDGTYALGSVVTITVTPKPGWYLKYWSGIDRPTGNTATVTMTTDQNVMVHFLREEQWFHLWTNTDGGGMISPGRVLYNLGDQVTLFAIAFPGWTFDRWEGVDSSDGDQATVSISSDRTVTAYFTKQ